jgi:hypothetical protein
MTPVNLAFVRIAKRAEAQDEKILQQTFVDFGSVLAVLESPDHQVIFGRRGTGKTHLLTAARQTQQQSGVVAVQIDLRTIGSNGGIYASPDAPLAERATRILLELLTTLHDRLLEQLATNEHISDFDGAVVALNELLDACTAVRVVGTTTLETNTFAESGSTAEAKLGLGFAATGPNGTIGLQENQLEKQSVQAKKIVVGKEVPRLSFGSLGSAMRKLVASMPRSRLLLLIDEWSEVPPDLQPVLADLLKRALLPATGLSVKIAAIEQRSRFLVRDKLGNKHGLELGADIGPAINLDEYMVFENDETRAIEFFSKLIYAHVKTQLTNVTMNTPQRLIGLAFTQSNAFAEIVRACEGVPRDAINILSAAALRARDETISISHVRQAAQSWYQQSKDPTVSANASAKQLLNWIIDKVIKGRQTKAFLLKSGEEDKLIEFLFDERVLHVLRKGISSKDAPGIRFNVYGIDYGCYVDLLTTAQAPRGWLDLGVGSAEFSPDVPTTDLRSTRRCVLNLHEFYNAGSGTPA